MSERDTFQEAKNVFIVLCQEFGLDSYNIPVEALKKLDSCSEYMKYSSFKFIRKKDIIKEILKGKEDDVITYQEFVNWYTGNALKEILYQKTIDEQKYYIEDLTKIYYALGGDSQGIKKDTIKRYLKDYLRIYGDSDIGTSTIKKPTDSDKECEEIMDFLAQDKEIITLNEFVNIMTCQTPDKIIGREELAQG